MVEEHRRQLGCGLSDGNSMVGTGRKFGACLELLMWFPVRLKGFFRGGLGGFG